jgi:hypothetical protein
MNRFSATAALCCTLLGCVSAEEAATLASDEPVASEKAALNDDDTYVQISAAVLEGIIHDEAQKSMGSKVKWDDHADKPVEVTYYTSSSLHVRLNLKANRSVRIPIDVELAISLSCDWKHPALKLHVDEYEDHVHIPSWLSDLAEVVTIDADGAAQDMADDKVQKMIAKSMLLRGGLPIGSFCPQIDVDGAARITLDFSPGNECTGAQTHVTACKAPKVGDGVHSKCSNGYWQLDADHCGNCLPGQTEQGSCPFGYLGHATWSCVDRTWTRTNISGCTRDPDQDPPAHNGQNQP